MEILYWPKFAKYFKKLPIEIQKIAVEKEKIFKKDPFNPILKTHKLHGELSEYWSFSINYKIRIIFKFIDKNTVGFYLIGDHNIYE